MSACRPPSPPVMPGRPLPAVEPLVRVGVAVRADSATISATAPFTISTADGAVDAAAASAETWVVRSDASGRLLAQRSDAGASLISDGGVVRVSLAGEGHIVINGQPYRGSALLRSDGPGAVTAINVVELEAYLLGVVPAEIPSLELEAVKAQAVAARTYAVGHLGRRDSLGFDFFASVLDQVYAGVAAEDAMASRAVRETAGEVLLYDGMPILAYYHSTCGGRTAAIDEAWNRAPLPYLRSVSDMVPGTNGAYCDISNRYRWEVNWSGEALRAALEAGLREHLNSPSFELRQVTELEGMGRTASGRMAALRVVADGVVRTVARDSIRWILRAEPDRILNSTLIQELEVQRGGGEVVGVTVVGGGWGHGVGMCQMGAIGRARAGQGYSEILRAYYSGAEVARLY